MAISEQANTAAHSLVLSGVQPCSFTPGFLRPGKAEKELIGDNDLPSSLWKASAQLYYMQTQEKKLLQKRTDSLIAYYYAKKKLNVELTEISGWSDFLWHFILTQASTTHYALGFCLRSDTMNEIYILVSLMYLHNLPQNFCTL